MGNRSGDARRFSETDDENNMSTLTIQLPDGVARQLRECAASEGVTVDQLMSSAAAEKLSAMLTVEHLRERTRNAKREDFEKYLAASPNVPPMPGDEL